jgi:hypothetical protein
MTADLKACCVRWLESLKPRDSSAGRKRERHVCPTCHTPHVVLFDDVTIAKRVVCFAMGVD